jgi:hypothetical protein
LFSKEVKTNRLFMRCFWVEIFLAEASKAIAQVEFLEISLTRKIIIRNRFYVLMGK